jgi:hypothetical protein
MIFFCSSMNLCCCARVRIGNDGMLTSEWSSSSEEYVEVLGMKCSLFDDDRGDFCSFVARGMYPTLLVEE